jgi:Fe-S-cluster containining protein
MEELENPQSAGEFGYRSADQSLASRTDVDSCVSLAEKIAGRLNETLNYVRREVVKAGVQVACKAGCNFCCYLRVVVTPYEAIALFRSLSQMAPEQAEAIRQRVLSNAERIAAMTEAEHFAANLQCAFLVRGQCSVYSVRPSACAAHHSLRVEECEYIHNHAADFVSGGARIPASALLLEMREAIRAGITRAMKERRLNNDHTELHTAVAAILRKPSVIARWRSGRTLVKE